MVVMLKIHIFESRIRINMFDTASAIFKFKCSFSNVQSIGMNV